MNNLERTRHEGWLYLSFLSLARWINKYVIWLSAEFLYEMIGLKVLIIKQLCWEIFIVQRLIDISTYLNILRERKRGYIGSDVDINCMMKTRKILVDAISYKHLKICACMRLCTLTNCLYVIAKYTCYYLYLHIYWFVFTRRINRENVDRKTVMLILQV